MANEVEKTVKSVTKALTDIKKNANNVDDTIKGAVVGGVLGYLISEENKERNTVVGAGVGYVAGKYVKNKKSNF